MDDEFSEISDFDRKNLEKDRHLNDVGTLVRNEVARLQQVRTNLGIDNVGGTGLTGTGILNSAKDCRDMIENILKYLVIKDRKLHIKDDYLSFKYVALWVERDFLPFLVEESKHAKGSESVIISNAYRYNDYDNVFEVNCDDDYRHYLAAANLCREQIEIFMLKRFNFLKSHLASLELLIDKYKLKK